MSRLGKQRRKTARKGTDRGIESYVDISQRAPLDTEEDHNQIQKDIEQRTQVLCLIKGPEEIDNKKGKY
jgi:hypothetical protein